MLFGLGIFSLSTLGTWLFSSYARTRRILDVPNERSSHQHSVPRGAGIVFIALWMLGVVELVKSTWVSTSFIPLLVLPTVLIVLLSYWDDVGNLTARLRLMVQIIAASLFLLGLHSSVVEYSYLSLVFGLWLLIWSTNAYNFMDGLDGLAAVQALFVFGVGGWLFWQTKHWDMALCSWALLLSVGGFLVWNWPKAHVFMGDAGSCCLGFLAAAFALIAGKQYQLPMVLWLLLYSVFWFDATITIIRRFSKGENIFKAHCRHAYQRLHKAGFSHSRVLISVTFLNILISSIVLWASAHPSYITVCFMAIMILLLIAYSIVEYINPMWKEKEC